MTEKEKIEELRCVLADVSEQCEQLKAENASLRKRLEKTIELPFFQKDGDAIVLIYKNKDGVVLTETYFEDVYYGEKRGDDIAEARFSELKGVTK